jgi:aspartate aminotransferase
MTAPIHLSRFAQGLTGETAFDVLAVAQRLRAKGKDVVELQIGDSPFPSTGHALSAGVQAIQEHATHYCPSLGLAAFREMIAANYSREFGIPITAANVVVGPGAKVFEQFFCEAVLDPGDAVLVFSPHFPTYPPNIERRGARAVYSVLCQENHFRPDLNDIERFVRSTPGAKAIFINSPHNPTGGVATADDLRAIAELIRGHDIAVFADEPYCHMVWNGRHSSLLGQPGMMEQVVAAYTFSKSYSMSGWRVGYALSSPRLVDIIGKMINTSLSCVTPIAQRAALAALEHDAAERDAAMARFKGKVELLVDCLRQVDHVKVFRPAGTFYVFPNVSAICRRLGIQSHGLAMYLLEGADDHFGVACLGGECFGPAGQGFLRFSCAEPDDRLRQAVAFFAQAITREERVRQYLKANPKYEIANYPG